MHFVPRHCECELDVNCPYLILLECIEKKVLRNADDISILEQIDRHFLSYLHEADFRGKNRSKQFLTFHLTNRTRKLINPVGADMGGSCQTRQILMLQNQRRQSCQLFVSPFGQKNDQSIKNEGSATHFRTYGRREICRYQNTVSKSRGCQVLPIIYLSPVFVVYV